LQQKNFLVAETIMEIEEALKARDTAAQDIVMSSPANGDVDHLGDMPPSQTLPPPKKGNAPPKLDKRQVEQRIEEDRERHKRLREGIWAVPSGDYAEMDKLWEETSDLGEDDHRSGEEEWQEWKLAAQNSCPHRREAAHANGKHSS
jgi:CTD kinase subunit gamma